MASRYFVNCASAQLRKEATMARVVVKRTRKLACPTCGKPIHLALTRGRIGTCPECGDWLIRRSWVGRRLETASDELPDATLEGSDDWERALMDEIA